MYKGYAVQEIAGTLNKDVSKQEHYNTELYKYEEEFENSAHGRVFFMLAPNTRRRRLSRFEKQVWTRES